MKTDQGKRNFVRVSEEFELLGFYCNILQRRMVHKCKQIVDLFR